MSAPHPSGLLDDRPLRRAYEAKLRRAQQRYDAAMRRPRLLVRSAKGRADQLIRAGQVDEGSALIEAAFARFEKARQRSERNRDRIRRRAGRWLARQRDPGAFRRLSKAPGRHGRATVEREALFA